MNKNKKTSKNYKICIRCIMDATNSDIKFDEKGTCNKNS